MAQGDAKFAENDLTQAEQFFRLAAKAAEGSSINKLDLVLCQNRLANVLTMENKTCATAVYGSDNLLVKRTLGSLAYVLNKLRDTKQAVSL